MAAHANSLTERATRQGATPVYLWSLPSNDARTFLNGMSALGYDRRALLAAGGLDERTLADPDARIPCEALGKILSCAQQSRFTPNIALELARITPLGSSPLLDYLVVTSDTVDAGLRQLARYLRLVGNPVVLEVQEQGDDVQVRMSSGAAPFSVEYLAALMVLYLRSEAEGGFVVTSLNFQHRVDDTAEFERVLGCEVGSSSTWNGLSVPKHVSRLPLRRRDPVLRRLLESQADDILARLPARGGLAFEVQRALASRVIDRNTEIDTVARERGMSGRTLQRRLAAEGVSYQQLLDDARREAAARYLSEPTFAIGEVAYLVGYSEPAPFHRAFKRWFGMTPEQFRQTRRSASE